MDQQLRDVKTGAAFFTGLYFLVKSVSRFNVELYHDFNSAGGKYDSTKSRVCTWAMGAVGCGLLFASLH